MPQSPRSSSTPQCRILLAIGDISLGTLPTRRRHTKDDDDTQDGFEGAHPMKLANLKYDDEQGYLQPNTSDPQQPASRPVILLSNGKPLKSSLKSSSSSSVPHTLLPTFPPIIILTIQRARSDFEYYLLHLRPCSPVCMGIRNRLADSGSYSIRSNPVHPIMAYVPQLRLL